MNKEEKALAACVEVVSAAKEVKRLKRLIAGSLEACSIAYDKENPYAHPLAWESHLSAAYAHEVDEEEYGRVYLTPEEQQAVLSECPHCLAAHNAIQERKQARKRLGNARRAITRIGSAEA